MLLITLALLCAGCRAEAEPRWIVKAEVQMVALPVPHAVALLPQLRDAATFPATEARLQEMLAGGEAELLGWPRAEGFGRQSPHPGDKLPAIAEAAASEEVRYPSEFEPPQVPGGNQSLPPGWVILTSSPPQAIHAPTALDTRATGPLLQLRGAIDPQQSLHLTVIANLVWLAAMEPAIGARADRVDCPSIEQPRFRSLRTEATLQVRHETRQLLGVFLERRTLPRMILFLLHVRVLPAPEPL